MLDSETIAIGVSVISVTFTLCYSAPTPKDKQIIKHETPLYWSKYRGLKVFD